MKTIAIALSVATLFASAAVSAQETDYTGYTGFVSTKTRAEVKAETLAAIQRGEVRDGEQYGAPVQAAPVAKTRADVKAELAAYRKTHKEVADDIVSVQ
ncbi:DUF4148 domain-containing protein [Duganella callida]|uniref:DUF4148 domain-containing protein n=1 Tax=Duganella callida TaxID=2561932 RepID=A0A4Y9S8W4_9BURK|nr:DUF4148 domain-containing protein [Duganella callida]TFW15996.1 DUF4148 domain-containing protein [Duganella callida]